MFAIEWKHYICKCRLWVLVPLLCLCKFASMQLETVCIDTHITENREYQAFFKEYEGKLSLDKKTKIQETDDVLERYVSYADENPAKHYLINPTAWDSWIGNEKIDIILLLFVIFFSVYLVTNDYETGIYALIHPSGRFREKRLMGKQILLIIYSALIFTLSFLCEWVFYTVKYGLSGYSFPLQSLWTFENSPFNISVWQCCIYIHAVKYIAIFLMGEIAFLLGKYIKRLWISFLMGMGTVIIPYMIFNKEQIRYYIQPMGLVLGSGYFRGKSEPIIYDGVQISDPVEKIPVGCFFIILTLAILCYGIIFIVLFRDGGRKKCSWIIKSRFGFLFAGVSFLIISAFLSVLFLDSRNFEREFKGTYYQGKAYADGEKIYMSDREGRLIEHDCPSGKKEFIIRDVFAEKTCIDYYVDENYIYYYVKKDTGEVIIHRTDKSDFSTKIIYQKVNGTRKYMNSTKYLGLINVNNYENVSYNEWVEDNIRDFWVDGNYIFTIGHKRIVMTDYTTKEETVLIERGYSGGAVAYAAGILYYIDSDNKVVSFDVITQNAKYIDIPKCRSLAVSEERLCYITENGEIGVYSDTGAQNAEGMECSPTSSVVCHSKYVFCISAENTLICIDSTNLKRCEVKCYDESGKGVDVLMYNVRVYNDKKLSLYAEEGDSYDWILFDYDINCSVFQDS